MQTDAWLGHRATWDEGGVSRSGLLRRAPPRRYGGGGQWGGEGRAPADGGTCGGPFAAAGMPCLAHIRRQTASDRWRTEQQQCGGGADMGRGESKRDVIGTGCGGMNQRAHRGRAGESGGRGGGLRCVLPPQRAPAQGQTAACAGRVTLARRRRLTAHRRRRRRRAGCSPRHPRRTPGCSRRRPRAAPGSRRRTEPAARHRRRSRPAASAPSPSTSA